MRIAVAGTHGVGKTTLIEAFLRLHHDYAHEPEPYVVMLEEFGEEFGEPSVEDFTRQLEFNLTRLQQHTSGTKVIYERCPLDLLAYIAALDHRSSEALLGPVTKALKYLDLIVYLPLTALFVDNEYPKLQKAVDRRLAAMLREDDYGILAANHLSVIEASGSTAQRLCALENAMSYFPTTRQSTNSRH